MITLVYKLSKSSFAVGTLMIFKTLPALFFGSLVGVMVDRFDRKRLMVVCDISRGLLILTLPFIRNVFGVYVIAFLLETFSLIFMPAKDASIPNIVEQRDVLAANSISHTTNYLTMIIGSAFGATIILLVESVWGYLPFFQRLTGPGAAFYIDAATFFLSAAALSFMVLPPEELHEVGEIKWFHIKEDLFSGFSLIGKDKMLKYMILSIGVAILGGGSIYSLGVVYSTEVLKIGEAGFGYLISALGVGLVIGALVSGVLARLVAKDKLFGLSILAFGVAMVAFSSISYYKMVIAIIVFAGLNLAVLNVTGYTILHENIDDSLRGRVFSILQSVIKVFLLMSLALSGIVADIINWILKNLVENVVEQQQLVYLARFNGSRITLLLSGFAVIGAGALALKNVKINNERIGPVND